MFLKSVTILLDIITANRCIQYNIKGETNNADNNNNPNDKHMKNSYFLNDNGNENNA